VSKATYFTCQKRPKDVQELCFKNENETYYSEDAEAMLIVLMRCVKEMYKCQKRPK